MTARLVSIIPGSFILSIVTTALVLKVSHRMAWYDRTDGRKIHSGNIPRLGGIAFAFSFIAAFLIISFLRTGFRPLSQFLPVFLAFLLILTSGVRDDFKPLAPRYKLVFQTVAALCVLLSGHVFDRFLFVDRLDRPNFLNLPGWILFRYPLTFLWIVGMTNAVNFIDGVDGLAGGVSLLAALSFGGIFLSLGFAGPAPLLCTCLASAIGGFLVFNAPFPRAGIFMGDGGAYFLGFTLALFPLMGTGGSAPRLPVFHAAAIMLIPILDTTAAVWRRLRDGRRIDSPDCSHTHHKLMNLGLSSPRRIDAVLFCLQIVLSVLVYASVKTPAYLSLFFLALAYVAGLGFFIVLHFFYRRRMTISTDTQNHRVKEGGIRYARI
jgi:UDP-GlcNAc:undecaprenyl-phosphate GlcNAc-1-phosphate transferase